METCVLCLWWVEGIVYRYDFGVLLVLRLLSTSFLLLPRAVSIWGLTSLALITPEPTSLSRFVYFSGKRVFSVAAVMPLGCKRPSRT